jgi:membrane protease YdiL (CAAX protease family)
VPDCGNAADTQLSTPQLSTPLKEIRSILLFLIGTTLLGALLAPWFFWGGRALAARGIVPFLAETDFAQFFDRAVLVAAVALLWPTIRALSIRSRAELGIEPDPRGWTHLAVGFAAGFLCLGVFAMVALQFGVYRLKTEPPWGDVAKIAVSAFTVGVLEEWLFRGAFLGIFRRAMGKWAAVFWVSAIYSILHFVKPPRVDLPEAQIDWLTGFRVLPTCFEKFAEPALLGAGFTTLFLLGWILGWATLRTRALWLGIGLHAGLVFTKFGFSKLTKRKLDDTLPWLGEDIIVGLGALLVIAFAGALCWAWLHYVDRTDRTADR